ncbi:MAG TPA: PqiC family protein [Acetobacteraceae bacterium]
MKRRTLLAHMVPAGLALTGCASPEPAYFTLAAVPGIPRPGGPKLVELQRPGLAGYLDRPGIVRANGAVQLNVAANERWGEPLGDLIGRILAEDLGQRLPGSSVFTTAGSISAEPDGRIELDMQRFDADASGTVVLLAQVAVSRGRRANASTRTVRLTQHPTGPATRDLVAAMSMVLGSLADTLAGMLRGMPPSSPSPSRRGSG